MPGDGAAGADGCVSGTAQCAETACDEATDSCDCGDASDNDGDGVDSVACGGSDCDDDDGNRYPGNAELCDAEGHDEDCDDNTVGDLDEDSDGAFSFTCCNGDNCGTDCDDSDVNVNPSASEQCDGIDNDCDGEIDEAGDVALCPGGMCFAGRCSFTGWDRVFGGPGADVINAVAIDGAGNVYVAGSFSGTVTFGTTEVTSAGETDIFVMSYLPTGEYRWHATYGAASFDQATDIAARADGTLYVVGAASAETPFGGAGVGEGTGLLLVLDDAGTYLRHRRLPGGLPSQVALAGDAVVVASLSGSHDDFGCGVVASGLEATNSIVVSYDETLSCQWHSPTSARAINALTANEDTIVFAGATTADIALYGMTYPNEGESDFYVVSLDAANGARNWHEVYTDVGDVSVNDVAVDRLGQIYVIGRFEGAFNVGSAYRTDSGTDGEGFVLALSNVGTHAWHHFLDARGFDSSGGPDDGLSQLKRLSVLASGSVSIVGRWGTLNAQSNVLDLGGGDRTTSGGPQQFVVEYRNDGVFQRDFVVPFDESPLGVALGPGGMMVWAGFFAVDIELGSGTRTSRGGVDAWVARVGS